MLPYNDMAKGEKRNLTWNEESNNREEEEEEKNLCATI